MLKKILNGNDCAKCRICCVFDKYDLWETPVVTDELYSDISQTYPDISFVHKDSSRIFRMEPELADDGEELYYCPMLDKSTGCRLGDKKPFDCRIWPYRIMNFCGKNVISIASICPEMYSKPLSSLVGALSEEGLADKIFEYAAQHPDIVKPYQDGYPILMVEKHTGIV